MSRKHQSFPEKIAGISMGTALLFIATTAVAGIIGNRADTLFVWLWEIGVTVNLWPWIIFLLTIITGSTLAFLLFQRHSAILRLELHKQNNALDTMNALIKLDESLLRHLTWWMCVNDRQDGMKKLLANLLQDTTKAFAGEVHRAVIFLPDTAKEHLQAWAHYQMPQESLDRTIFFIGKDEKDRKRGLAGEAFLDKKPSIAHIPNKTPGWKCDREDCYINFDKSRPFPPYRSLICIPLLIPDPSSSTPGSVISLGVVCFDSENLTIFDNLAVQDLLETLAMRIVAALLIYEQYHP